MRVPAARTCQVHDQFAIAHGLAGRVGSVEAGKFADLVIWKPAFFGGADGELLTCEPARVLPMAQRYFLF